MYYDNNQRFKNEQRRSPDYTPTVGPMPRPNPNTPPNPSTTPGQMPNPMTQPRTEPNKGKRVTGKPKGMIDSIKELGTPDVPETKSNIQCVTIIGQVEGHLSLPPQNKTTKYEHIIPQLVGLEQSNEVEGVLLILNTVGGDVEAGLAISEMVASMSKPTVSIVLGGGHSIGGPIAVSTDYSFIAETASMTIHPIRLNGLVVGVPQTYEYLDKMQDRVIGFVTQHSRIKEDKFRELMFRTGDLARDIGTVLIGDDAVKAGLIDEVGGLGKAVQKLRQMIDQNNNQRGVPLQ